MKKKVRLKKKAVALLILILVLLFTPLIMLFTRKKVEMLNFVLKSEAEAEDFCLVNDCELSKNYAYDLEILEGQIISQNKKAGEKLRRHEKIEITISKGINYQVYIDNNVNELGRIPVMMYHGIIDKTNEETSYTGGNVDKDGYQRTYEAFISDLEFYYQSGYRMISLIDYVNGVIDCELGKSPIVLTFDDGLTNSLKVLGLNEDGSLIIDPHSAVGILESFKAKYPDYNVTATFFINGGLFKQTAYNDKIIAWLINHGYDIGNHTYSHADLTKTTEEETIKEIGRMYKLLETKTKDYVPIVALPYGTPYSSTHVNFKHILSGTYDGFNYQTLSTLRVGWESDYSPFSTSFNPNFIKRIRAYDNNGNDFDIAYNFKFLESRRFISDGNAKTITIKKGNEAKVNTTNLKIISY